MTIDTIQKFYCPKGPCLRCVDLWVIRRGNIWTVFIWVRWSIMHVITATKWELFYKLSTKLCNFLQLWRRTHNRKRSNTLTFCTQSILSIQISTPPHINHLSSLLECNICMLCIPVSLPTQTLSSSSQKLRENNK